MLFQQPIGRSDNQQTQACTHVLSLLLVIARCCCCRFRCYSWPSCCVRAWASPSSPWRRGIRLCSLRGRGGRAWQQCSAKIDGSMTRALALQCTGWQRGLKLGWQEQHSCEEGGGGWEGRMRSRWWQNWFSRLGVGGSNSNARVAGGSVLKMCDRCEASPGLVCGVCTCALINVKNLTGSLFHRQRSVCRSPRKSNTPSH